MDHEHDYSRRDSGLPVETGGPSVFYGLVEDPITGKTVTTRTVGAPAPPPPRKQSIEEFKASIDAQIAAKKAAEATPFPWWAVAGAGAIVLLAIMRSRNK